MMKRVKVTIISILLGVALGSALSAAGGQGQAPEPGKSGGKIPIQLWHYQTTLTAETLEKAIAEYNALPNGLVSITPQYLPRNELLKRYALGVVSNDLPEIGFVDNPDSASFAAMGMWLDITAKSASLPHPNYLDGPVNSGKLNGKQYTLPMRSNCLGLWSNDQMIRAAGITKLPETWDELLAVCAALKKANPNVYPLAFCAAKTEEGTFQFLPWLLSTGATWDQMDTNAASRALTFYKTLMDNKYISPEVINWSQNDVEKQFASGNAAMMINGSWHVSNLKVDVPDMKYTVSNIPRDQKFASSLGGENLGMTKAAAGKEDQAWDFIKWFLSLEVNVPYNTQLGTLCPNLDAKNQYPNDPVMQAFEEQIRYTVARGPHPKWPELSTAIQEAIQETITGTKAPAQAGTDASVKIKAINASVR
jgi:multiple sugar transport system substrate-binding protein